jgi:aryl-alcohol dehydrogenase-like predicted oxidoreductase
MGYGDSELIIGEFLRGRRSKWIVATKFSNQDVGMTVTLEQQLRRLGIDVVDYYQIHWAPRDDGQHLYEEIYRLKLSGKVRFVGVSLHSSADVDYVIDKTQLDGVMLRFSLLDPMPFLPRLARLRSSGLGVIAHSSLHSGFLTGRYQSDVRFTDPNDRRSKWSAKRIAQAVARTERFRFLEREHGTLFLAAARYPLSFPEISTVVLGTKSASYADDNFGAVPGGRLSPDELRRVASLQDEIGLWSLKERVRRTLQRLGLAK